VTHAAWSPPAAETAARSDFWRIASLAAAALILLLYSQAWVFPLIGDKPSTDQGGLVRILFLPAYAAAFMLLAQRPGRTAAALLRQPFLIVLMVIVALSILWSVSPDQSLRRAVAVYCTTLGAVTIAARYRWSELADLIAGCFAALAVIVLLVSLLLPSIGVMTEIFPGAWRGVWPEKNAMGGVMAIGVVVIASAAAINPARAKVWAPLAALALGMVLMSTSKTSLVAVMLGLGALAMVMLARRGPAAAVTVAWFAVVALGGLAGVMLLAPDLLLNLLGKDATLTGRTRIWAAVMRQIAERPWTGYGYDAVWNETGTWGPKAWIVKQAGFTPQHAHNAWLEQWLGLGLAGLSAFVLFYAQTLILAVAAAFRERGAYLAVPFLVVYSLMTVTESVAVTYHDLRWVLFVIVAVKLAWPDARDRPPT
jgi:O-antigen ligase